MNILQILPSLDVGGVETGTIDLARYLVRGGHKAIVISGGGRLVKELDKIGARHYTLPVGKKSIFSVIKMVRRVCDIIRNEDIDIVHVRSRVPALIAYIACRITNRIFLTTAHGYYKKHFLSKVMSWGRFVIVPSNVIAKHMISDFGVPYDRIRFIPRGVDLSKFKFRSPGTYHSKEFTVGMVSRITPLKGHSFFIKAISLLRKDIPNLKVVIVGSAAKDKYMGDLQMLTRRFGLTRIVEFLSAREDIPSIMHGLDCLVSATITPEAFGRAIVEAQASGVAVVSTKVGGVVDIIEDGKSGLFCNAQDPKDMADKILKLYRDKDLRAKLVMGGRKRVEENFNLDIMMKKTLSVYEEALKAVNILVIKMSAIGDVILSVPSLRAIRSKYKNADIKVLVGLQARDVLDGCPYIGGKIVCDFTGKDKGLYGLWKLGEDLRKCCFDIVIDLQNNKKSHMLSFLSLAPLSYGYSNGKFSFLMNNRIKDDAPYLDPIEHQFRLLRSAGIKPVDKHLELWPSSSDAERIDALFLENWIKPSQSLIGINARASSRWNSKNWPPKRIAELCDRLAKEFNMRVVLTGTKEDALFIEKIRAMTASKPVAAAGRTAVMELASLIKRCKIYITPDSAPMHIASALGTPFIALFGPTDPVRHVAPSKDYVVIKKNLKCSPCYNPNCSKGLKCMSGIEVEEVFTAVKNILSRSEGAL
ncbi:MAG: lipopolysaccharide heptosyltransferase II [Candidatus Omnitrophota bacterium]|jgi:lipopolysaccharide heptosyltransferase II|nr:lipopolysaccharide heptosyltransferase II [Candidatus Omnitrophota bacterium]